MQNTAEEVKTNSYAMYSCGNPHMDEQKVNDKQVFAETGCSLEDRPGAMDDRYG